MLSRALSHSRGLLVSAHSPASPHAQMPRRIMRQNQWPRAEPGPLFLVHFKSFVLLAYFSLRCLTRTDPAACRFRQSFGVKHRAELRRFLTVDLGSRFNPTVQPSGGNTNVKARQLELYLRSMGCCFVLKVQIKSRSLVGSVICLRLGHRSA